MTYTVFTVQRIAMLFSALNSDRANEVNIAIMRAFVQRWEISSLKSLGTWTTHNGLLHSIAPNTPSSAVVPLQKIERRVRHTIKFYQHRLRRRRHLTCHMTKEATLTTLKNITLHIIIGLFPYFPCNFEIRLQIYKENAIVIPPQEIIVNLHQR